MPRPVDLVAVRADLDRLAVLGVELAERGGDVFDLLDREDGGDDAAWGGGVMVEPLHGTSIRLAAEDLEAADRLVAALARTPEARALGGRWGRSAVLRLAVVAGLDALRRRADELAGDGAP
jgi:hypothetical protein